MDRYLAIIEVSQKQRFIFSSNKLSQNIGASIIIREITEMIPRKHCTDEEVFFVGGGKSVYEFDSEERAKEFISCVSEEAIEQYPGVEVFMALQKYEAEKERVLDAVNKLYSNLEKKKSIRKSSFVIQSMGITQLSENTNKPVIVGTDGLSAEEFAKEKAARSKRQKAAYADLLPEDEKYEFAMEFEDLGGTKHTKSYIGVIALDGNRMDKKFTHFRNAYEKRYEKASAADDIYALNCEYKKAYRNLSETIERVYRLAVRATNTEIASRLDEMYENKKLTKNKKDGKVILPFRPLIAAGDDICIVTDGRIALLYTEILLNNIKTIGDRELAQIPGFRFEMRACAGITLISGHYPFFRAHELAEELASNAKKQLPDDDASDTCVMDFHIVQGEIEGSLSEIRKTKYDSSRMTAKPYFIEFPSTFNEKQKNEAHTLEQLKACIRYLKKADVGRGILKEYRDALTSGEQAMRAYLNEKRMTKILGKYERGLAFDAIETMDIYYGVEDIRK
ncbi:MAG: hypothetical protein IKG46_12605 [Solobacterium sp.]|nr:hypothetical protein [Solobacterium sp.]